LTDPDYTAIALVVDRSGSMASIATDASGAISHFIKDQREQPGRTTVKLVQFDDQYDVVYPSTDIHQVPEYQLVPRGNTALLDAIGRTVTDFGHELAALPEANRPSTVIVVVQTDGLENASRNYGREQIAGMIQNQEANYGWKFVYLGANQDAIAVGQAMGFHGHSTMDYMASGAGVRGMSAGLSNYVNNTRTSGTYAFTDADRLAAVAPEDEGKPA
jgi:Mg-chelatase subunit ChlD